MCPFYHIECYKCVTNRYAKSLPILPIPMAIFFLYIYKYKNRVRHILSKVPHPR